MTCVVVSAVCPNTHDIIPETITPANENKAGLKILRIANSFMTLFYNSSQTECDQHKRVGQQIRSSSRFLCGGRPSSRCSSNAASTSPAASTAAAKSVVDGGTSAADAAAVFESADSRIGSRTIRSIGLVFKVRQSEFG